MNALRLALKDWSEETWCQYHRERGDAFCALGRLDLALGGKYRSDTSHEVAVLARVIREHHGKTYEGYQASLPGEYDNLTVASWNNAPLRSFAEIQALFEEAANRMESSTPGSIL